MNPHDSFTHRRKGRIWVPLDAFAMGEFQMPKHIHWTVDMLSKMFADKLQT